MPETDRYLTAQEVADRLRVSKVTVYRMARSGEGPEGKRFGSQLRFPESSVEAWIEAQETVGGTLTGKETQ